ncbi:MAG TPA: hypothetical protein VG106_10860, partial [Vicinamibacterales bacterium]|nr:hypothetical protein [Vicinamibacterales bacterium]
MPHPPAFPALALLHTAARIEWSSFTVHGSTVVGLAGLAALYEWRAVRGARSAAALATHRGFFYSGLGVIFFALNGWLHDLSDYYLFSAHMVQEAVVARHVLPAQHAHREDHMRSDGRPVRQR